MRARTMHDENFRDRAMAFAAGAGSVVLILALLATDTAEKIDLGTDRASRQALDAIALSVVTAAVTSVATMRALEPVARALDTILEALRTAAAGALDVSFGRSAAAVLPHLVASLEVLLRRVRSSLDDIQQLALHDPVTDLPNRLHFRRLVDARTDPPDPAVLLFIDLDRFKAVNDSLGHSAGDRLLALFAARVRGLLGAYAAETGLPRPPVVARLAGDEFTVLVPGVADPDEGTRLARRILDALEEPFDLGGRSVVVAASIGIACRPDDGADYDRLMRNADAAMYHAKALGRNQHSAYSADLNRQARDRLRLEGELRDACATGGFELLFQPMVAARTGLPVSAEALLRWNHPGGELRLPDSFIDVAEESGLILDIGRWVLDRAAATAARWAAQGLDCRLAFNVSPRQLARPDFVDLVKESLAAYGADARRLEIEISESLVMTGDSPLIERVARLRELGLSIAIDDFGTGYSNLARLKHLPIDRLKIDRSLVQDIARSADARTIVNAIVSLAHGLGYDCVAEGVETPLQADILGVVGCELLQGYAFARPMDEADFVDWMAGPARRARTA